MLLYHESTWGLSNASKGEVDVQSCRFPLSFLQQSEKMQMVCDECNRRHDCFTTSDKLLRFTMKSNQLIQSSLYMPVCGSLFICEQLKCVFCFWLPSWTFNIKNLWTLSVHLVQLCPQLQTASVKRTLCQFSVTYSLREVSSGGKQLVSSLKFLSLKMSFLSCSIWCFPGSLAFIRIPLSICISSSSTSKHHCRAYFGPRSGLLGLLIASGYSGRFLNRF